MTEEDEEYEHGKILRRCGNKHMLYARYCRDFFASRKFHYDKSQNYNAKERGRGSVSVEDNFSLREKIAKNERERERDYKKEKQRFREASKGNKR